MMKLIIDIAEDMRSAVIDRANNGASMPVGIQAIMVKAIVNGIPFDDIKEIINNPGYKDDLIRYCLIKELVEEVEHE